MPGIIHSYFREYKLIQRTGLDSVMQIIYHLFSHTEEKPTERKKSLENRQLCESAFVN